MNRQRKDLPPHNYAKMVQKLPELRKEVTDALSNQFGRSNLLGSGYENQQKIYHILHNNAYYKGPWSRGLPNGKGFCIFSDGTFYEGNFVDGDAQDKEGYLILTNGAIYRGSIVNSVLEGKGEMKQNIGNEKPYSYSGEWKAGRPHGMGKEVYGDDSWYEGYFKEGVKSCYDETKTIKEKEEDFSQNCKQLEKYSIYQSPATCENYRGQFLNGRMNGYGEYYRSDRGIRYSGEFLNGKKQGYGTLQSDIGTLTGYFENDVINGEGRFQWSQKDGRVYTGNFRNSKFHGSGKIILTNGNVLEGNWEDGHNIELKSVRTTHG